MDEGTDREAHIGTSREAYIQTDRKTEFSRTLVFHDTAFGTQVGE